MLWQYIDLLINKNNGRNVSNCFVSFALIGGIGVVAHDLIRTLLYKGYEMAS